MLIFDDFFTAKRTYKKKWHFVMLSFVYGSVFGNYSLF